MRVTEGNDARGVLDSARDLAVLAEQWGYPHLRGGSRRGREGAYDGTLSRGFLFRGEAVDVFGRTGRDILALGKIQSRSVPRLLGFLGRGLGELGPGAGRRRCATD